MDTILGHEAVIRLAVFLGVLGAMALWEVAAPRRRREIPRLLRWSNNLALVVLDTLAVRLLFPVLAVGLALVTAERSWGLLHLWPVPGWFAFVASVLLLDLAIYLQHDDKDHTLGVYGEKVMPAVAEAVKAKS